MFAFFCIWFLIVVGLKCLGYSVVGFFSGSNVRIPVQPTSYGEGNGEDEKQRDKDDGLLAVNVDGDVNVNQSSNNDLEGWKEQVRLRERRIRNIRIAVIISGLIIIVMTVLMLVYGIRSLNASVKDGRDGLYQGVNLTNDAITLIDNYLYRQNTTLQAARTVQVTADEVICPDLRDVICSDPATFNCDDILNLESSSTVQDIMDQVLSQLVQVRSDLVEVSGIINNINQEVSQFSWAFWVAAGAVILMAVCTILILNGVIMAWQNKLHGTCWQRTTSCFRGWFIVPLFVFLLIIGWVFSMVFVMGYTATSDFCFNSPDENVQAVLGQYKDKFSSNSIVYPTLVYYVSGCPQKSEILQVGEKFISLLLYYLEEATKGIDLIASQAGTVAAQCGTDPDTLRNALFVLESQLCTVASTIYDFVDFFTCSNFNGLYATVAYDAVCDNGNTGFVWIAFTQFMIILCAMIMLTLRVAFYEIVDESELIPLRRGCCPCGSRGRAEGGFDDAVREDDVAEPVTKESAKSFVDHDTQSRQSGDGFDEIVSSAVGQAFHESERGDVPDGDGKLASNNYYT